MSAQSCFLMSGSGLWEEASSMEWVPVAVACVSVVPLLFGLRAAWCKFKDVKKRSDIHQKKKEDEAKMTSMVSTLQQQRTGLEETKDQLTSLLEKVKTEKVENKKELQSVEDEIREREKQSDKPKELITAKENLLKAQWKLDETKKNYERLKMMIENLMEL